MKPNPSQENGHNVSRRLGEERVLNGIHRAADALTERVESVYGKIDAAESQLQGLTDQVTQFLEERPVQALAITFFAGMLAGAWMASRD